MKRMIAGLLLVVLGCASNDPPSSDVSPVAVEGTEQFLGIPLLAPDSEGDAGYLGIVRERTGYFLMNQIRAEVLLIQIFDMYCPHCQAAAPEVNELFNLTRRRGLDDRLKMIGVGRGNTGFEVRTYKERYGVEFPLFGDKERKVTRRLHADLLGTPAFIVVSMDPPSEAGVIHMREGAFTDPKEFLKVILKTSGLE
jgi:hypothetical protein